MIALEGCGQKGKNKEREDPRSTEGGHLFNLLEIASITNVARQKGYGPVHLGIDNMFLCRQCDDCHHHNVGLYQRTANLLAGARGACRNRPSLSGGRDYNNWTALGETFVLGWRNHIIWDV